MNEETQIFTKEEPTVTSHFKGISIRAWLALGLILTVCFHSIAAIIIAVITKDAKLLVVSEPLYTMSGMALAYYFGQQKQTTK